MYEWIAFLENALNNNFTFSVIFVLGMFHALEPGHGKTLILAYMSGGSMRFSGTIQLVLGLITTHFLLFSLIAFLLQIGSESFPFLNAIGPLLIILLGIYLLYRSVKEVRHEHDDECDEPMHFHFNQSKFSSPFITGTVAGLIPCPSAIIIFIASEVAKKSIILGSIIVSLPLMSLLTISWLQIETKDTQSIISLSYNIFWLTLLSLSFFILFPYLLKKNISFGLSMGLSLFVMVSLFFIFASLLKRFGIEVL